MSITFFIIETLKIFFLSFLLFEFIILLKNYFSSKKNIIKNEFQEAMGELSFNWSQAAGLDETSKSGSETFGDPLLILGILSAFLSFVPFFIAINADFTFILSFSIIIILLSFLILIPLTLLKIFTEVIEKKSPLVLIPALVVIESISYIFKVLSLTIRISVNTATGHALSLIFFTLCCNVLENMISISSKIFGIFFYIFWIIYMVMEIFISLLQLYVINLLAYYYEFENF